MGIANFIPKPQKTTSHLFTFSIHNIMENFEQILFKIVLESNPEMIIRAHQIEKEFITIPKEVNVYVNQNEMTTEMKIEMGENLRSREMSCPVIGNNPYKMNNRYLIQLPNGSTRWADGR